MGRLGAKDHDALVLRFFENKTFVEVGAALGASEDAAKMRVGRALEKLHRHFERHGISSTTAVIADEIGVNAMWTAPAGLANAITAVALAKGVSAGASTLTLVKGALKIMAWTKSKTVLVSALMLLVAVGSTTVAVQHFKRQQMPPDPLRRIEQSSGYVLTTRAIAFLHQLKTNSLLPGVQSDEQIMVVLPTRLTDAETFPVSLELHARKGNAGGPFPYHYVLAKASVTNEWRLLEAWHVGANGALERYSLP
jgi:hypothetical protein